MFFGRSPEPISAASSPDARLRPSVIKIGPFFQSMWPVAYRRDRRSSWFCSPRSPDLRPRYHRLADVPGVARGDPRSSVKSVLGRESARAAGNQRTPHRRPACLLRQGGAVTRWRKAAPSTPAPYRKSPRTAEQDSNRRSLSRRSRPLFGRDSWGIPGQSNGGSLKKALFLLGGPRVRILLPPALSYVRTRLPRSVGRLASTCGYHCPLGGSGLPGENGQTTQQAPFRTTIAFYFKRRPTLRAGRFHVLPADWPQFSVQARNCLARPRAGDAWRCPLPGAPLIRRTAPKAR